MTNHMSDDEYFEFSNAAADDLTDLPLEDYDTNAILDGDDLEEWEYDLMNALNELDDFAGGTVSLADFPADPQYCECCGGVIIETDYLYTGSLDRCYFCMDCDCMSARTPGQEAQWRKSREEARQSTTDQGKAGDGSAVQAGADNTL